MHGFNWILILNHILTKLWTQAPRSDYIRRPRAGASYQVCQMGELVPVDVPPLHVVLMGLQRQDGRFCGGLLELEGRTQGHTHTTC